MPMSINRSTIVSIDPSTPTAVVLAPGAGDSHGSMSVVLTFKTVGAQSGGQWLVMEYTAPPQFSGPPPHWHKITTEIFYMLEGTLTLSAGDETIQAGPGGYAYVPPGTVHGFSNQTDAPAKYLLIASPAGLAAVHELRYPTGDGCRADSDKLSTSFQGLRQEAPPCECNSG